MLYNHKHKIAFWSVPKTGSTSMKAMLLRRFGAFSDEGYSSLGRHAMWRDRSDNQKTYKNYLNIFAVREPIAWAKSLYQMCWSIGHNQFVKDFRTNMSPSEFLRAIKYTPCDWFDGMPSTEMRLIYRLEDIDSVADWFGLDVERRNVASLENEMPFDLYSDDVEFIKNRFQREFKFYRSETC